MITQLQRAAGWPGARILGLGCYQPGNVLTNDDLSHMVDTNDEWIRSRVGIASRRIADPDESVADMATIAGGKALADSGIDPHEIELVIAATCTMESQIPGAAAQVAHRLDIPAPGAFDVNAACAGFCYALSVAHDAVRAGSARYVLVVAAEKLSSWVDWSDRHTCILFADGAGAAVVGPAQRAEQTGIGPVAWGSAGKEADKIQVKTRRDFLSQEGQAVFRWATTALYPVALAACEKAGIAPTDLAAFVPHQANLRIIEAIARRLGAPEAVIADDIVTAGNTSSASIPLALCRLVEQGRVDTGQPALLIGFGAGLTYAAQVITIP